ncbi:hypothetical protein D3C72_2354880 [compost metagenome]
MSYRETVSPLVSATSRTGTNRSGRLPGMTHLCEAGKGSRVSDSSEVNLSGAFIGRHSLLRERVLRNRSMDLGRPVTEKGSDGPKSGSAALLTPV